MNPRAPIFSALVVTALVACGGKPSPEQATNKEPSIAPQDTQAVVSADIHIEVPVSSSGGEPQLMATTHSISGNVAAPRAGSITAVEVQVGNFGNTADGAASAKLCQGENCVEASADIATSKDNEYLKFVFPNSLAVVEAQPINFTFARVAGEKPFALWTYPSIANGELVFADSSKAQKDVKIALTYSGS